MYKMNIYGIKRTDLEQYFQGINEKKYKALQVFEWLYVHKVKSFNEMTNIKKELQEKLEKDFSIKMIDENIIIDMAKELLSVQKN